ncbi:MAG: DUF4198 domain-containing protein [Pseudoleptotrichia goodfellowii]|nr:DUF4198 domain-containing protein [Pseudoleptotrichia goodfellowii]
MKKFLGVLAVLTAATVNLYAHNQFIYTDTLNVTGKSSVPFKVIFGHPYHGGEDKPIPVGKVKEKTHLAEKVFAVHDGQKIDLTAKVKEGQLKTDKALGRTLDFVIDSELKGAGDWVIIAVPGLTVDDSISYSFNGIVKTVITKEGSKGDDWKKRVADGYYEIIPFTNPSMVNINSVFKGRLVDKKGNPMKNTDISVNYVNGKLDAGKGTFTGKLQNEKVSMSTYTDDNGYFVLSFPHKGLWSIRGKAFVDREKKYVEDTSLLIEVK